MHSGVVAAPQPVNTERNSVSVGRRRFPLRLLLGLGLALAFVVVVSVFAWGGNPVTLASVTVSVITALSLGSIYAMSATGIVVTYTATGVFNFAQGAIGMLLTYVFWELSVAHGVPVVAALLISVLIAAPLVGVILDRLIMRHIVGTSLVVQLVVSIGLMLGLMGLAQTIWDPNTSREVNFLFGTHGFHVGHTVVLWHRALSIVLAGVLALALRLLLHRTRAGVTMRAVVDSGPLAALYGARPDAVSMMAWALSTSLAALAGILLAPETGVNVQPLTLITISAFAAAIVGRMKSLPLTFLGAMALGAVSTYSTDFLQLAGRWSNFNDAIPAIFLMAALLTIPAAKTQLAAGQLLRRTRPRLPELRESAVALVILVAIVIGVSQGMGQVNLNRMAIALATSILLLSYIPLTGWAGQVSLAQITFAGVGAFTMWKAAGSTGDFWGLLLAGAVAAPFGCLMALPALRLQGLYLALASMAFALLGENLLFPQPEVFGDAGRQINRPTVWGINFSNERTFLILLAVVFALLGFGLVVLRRSGFGRRLVALRESEAACVTAGVNPIVTKLVVFGFSAALAGMGGGLLAMQRGSASASDFTMLAGLPLLLLVVVGGVEYVGGALFGGVISVLLTVLEGLWHVSFLNSLEILGPGLLALGVARSPGGSVAELSRVVSPLLPWRRREQQQLRRRLDDIQSGPPGDVPNAGPGEASVAAKVAETSTGASAS